MARLHILKQDSDPSTVGSIIMCRDSTVISHRLPSLEHAHFQIYLFSLVHHTDTYR